MDKKEWNKLVAQYQPAFGGFLQSWEWGDFQHSLGREIERVFYQINGRIMIAQAIQMDLPAGQFYWYLPKGPIGNFKLENQVEKLRSKLPDGIFLRMEPDNVDRIMRVDDVQPSTTLMINLEMDEEDIFQSMKSKTRYNIRLGNRKGVECKFVTMDKFDDFVRLMEQTTIRDKFKAHPSIYYKTMLETMSGNGAIARLAMAFYKDHVIAANVIIDFAGTRTYLHGATSNLHRNVMGQYALHGFLIQDAKRKGMKLFDFWGVAPDGSSEKHPWYGITRYKRGFGGEIVQMSGTFDIPMKHLWYWTYKVVKNLK